MSEKRPERVEKAEMWEMRALLESEGRIKAEATLLQNQLGQIQQDLTGFGERLRAKYGQDARIHPDGRLEYGTPAPQGIARIEPPKEEPKDPSEPKVKVNKVESKKKPKK